MEALKLDCEHAAAMAFGDRDASRASGDSAGSHWQSPPRSGSGSAGSDGESSSSSSSSSSASEAASTAA